MELKYLLLAVFFIAQSRAQDVPSITCTYVLSAPNYICYYNIINPNGEDNFTSIGGEHAEGMTNADVTTFLPGTVLNTTNIPQIFCSQFPNVNMAVFSFLNVRTLANNPFSGCTNLTWLSLWANPVGEIPEGTFANNRLLEYLDLDSTNLTTLPVNVFQSQSNLRTLDIRSNPFAALPGGVFRPVSNLVTLYLTYCNISSINRMW